MASIIDSLFIELGLDTSKFDKSAKKSVDQLRNMEDQAKKTSQNIEKGAKDIGEGFNFAKDALIAFGSVLSFNAFKNFLVDTTKTNVALGNTSNLLGMSARELKSWGQMAQLVGGNLESITGTFKNFQSNLAQVKMGGGQDFLKNIAYIQQATGKDLGFDFAKGTYDVYKLSDALADLKGKVTSGQYLQFTQAIGITPDSLVLLEKGSAYLHKNEDAFNKLNEAMDKNVANSQRVNEQWTKIASVLDRVAQSIYGKTMDFLFMRKPNSSLTDEEWNKQVGYTPGGKTAGAAPKSVSESRKALMEYFQSQGWSKAQAAGIVGNLQQESSFNTSATNKSHMGTHRGIAQWDPERQADFKTWAGFDITDPRANDLMLQAAFVNFELQKGKKIAVGNALKKMTDYQSSSDLISNKYEIAGDASNWKRMQYAAAAYGESANMIGANNTAPLSAGGSKNEVNTNIQSVVVNTQATDANGIARDMGKALQQNTLINAGIVGNF